ncbi:MAG TPA: hypothetical protein PLG24_05740, partial [Saprospiraceae bacterium]|nr:hypothetical protein [Saprospiraceae bacterium]
SSTKVLTYYFPTHFGTICVFSRLQRRIHLSLYPDLLRQPFSILANSPYIRQTNMFLPVCV